MLSRISCGRRMILLVSDSIHIGSPPTETSSATPLRNKLVLTLAVALTPVLFLSGLKAYMDAQDARDNQRQTLVLVADAAIDGVDQSLDEAELLLTLFESRIANGECSGIYNQLTEYLPALSNVISYDAEDNVTCAAIGQPRISREAKLLHDNLRAGKDFILRSDAFFGDSSNAWIFSISRRVEGPAGEFEGINTFALRADKLADLMRSQFLTDGVALSLADEEGRVFGEPIVGPIASDWLESVRESRTAQLFRLNRDDGNDFDIVLKPVGATNIYAVISQPTYGVWNDIILRPATSFGLPLLAFAVTLLAAWMAIDGLVLRWISRLTRTVKIYGAGRYSFKAGNSFVDAPAEISSLNLQIVTSFLNLQGRQLHDPQAKAAIAATRHRIDALAIVHQTLYQNERLERVDMRPFLTGLLNHLSEALGMKEAGITLVQSYDDIERDADDAIPMALFIVEAVTNAMKYAFGDAHGEVSVKLNTQADKVILLIQDTGLGYDADAQANGLGSKLMMAFARQMSADFTTETKPGAGCLLRLEMDL